MSTNTDDITTVIIVLAGIIGLMLVVGYVALRPHPVTHSVSFTSPLDYQTITPTLMPVSTVAIPTLTPTPTSTPTPTPTIKPTTVIPSCDNGIITNTIWISRHNLQRGNARIHMVLDNPAIIQIMIDNGIAYRAQEAETGVTLMLIEDATVSILIYKQSDFLCIQHLDITNTPFPTPTPMPTPIPTSTPTPTEKPAPAPTPTVNNPCVNGLWLNTGYDHQYYDVGNITGTVTIKFHASNNVQLRVIQDNDTRMGTHVGQTEITIPLHEETHVGFAFHRLEVDTCITGIDISN